jgi:hypothetical protein
MKKRFMETVRFAKIVESSGKPDTHLLLTDPAKDKTLQAAIKSNRVMTVHQESGSTKTDYGTVGFEEGASRQFLLFPKTLKPFAGKRVVGIKYDLLESTPITKEDRASKRTSEQAPKPTNERVPRVIDTPQAIPKSKADKPKNKTTAKPEERRKGRVEKAPPSKLVEFPKPESSKEASAATDEVQELKRRVREAMDALEQGKQVAAFNLLKRIVEG